MSSLSQWSGQATIGVDVGGSYVKGVIADADGQVVGRVRRPSGRHAGPDAVLEATFATLDAAIGAVPEHLTLGAAGVAVPGVVDDGAAVVRWAANLGWRDLPIRALIEARADLPVWCGHDVHAGGVAEFRHGAGRQATTGAFVPVGTGIAAALLIDGRSHRGGGLAGEIGHLDVGHGEPCRCGRTGCLEAVASAASIARRYAERTNTTAEGSAQVVQRVRAGEAAAVEVWQDAVQALSFALSWLSGVLAPDVVVLGGGLGRAGDLLLQPLRASLAARFTYQDVPHLVCAEFGDEAGAVGAALLAREVGVPRADEGVDYEAGRDGSCTSPVHSAAAIR